jgi:ribonuclease Z
MRLIVLGTGEAMSVKCYNTCFAIDVGGEFFLIDGGGGNGILGQFMKAGIFVKDIHHLFVTHEHADHVLRAIWVLRAVAEDMLDGRFPGRFCVYCHDELLAVIDQICRMLFPQKLLRYFGNGIYFREVREGDLLKVLNMELLFFDIRSRKAKQFGFRALLPDGKTLVCLGDEPFNEADLEYAKDPDWLLSEAMCLYGEREIYKPYEKFHSTVLDAARTAQRLGAKNLILYHTVDDCLSDRKERFIAEASTAFAGRIFVPEDLEVIRL